MNKEELQKATRTVFAMEKDLISDAGTSEEKGVLGAQK